MLTFIGALNWGFIGFFGFDLIAALFGDMSVITRCIYCIIGFSSILSVPFILKPFYESNKK